ncbi:DUF3040 domain-containing protein [Brevibacterium sp. 5221]|uniref:DUF3040 domain-containing protein n=1 Tax=Brevibacterium rongguiense TaxID=2695267 RepID=A0A6N9HB16_9MICO|nr:DUF3040 domain-containing protein [Brevibacterium rongguiense]MYM20921.1 DUF3040 domain-containing protein [Brevibacterium rongguiense]
MPLSDHEQQLLDQLEKQLRTEDPRFAHTIAQAPASQGPGLSAKRFVAGILALVVGIGIAVASIFFLDLPFSAIGGVVGFAVMVFGGYWAVSGTPSARAAAAESGAEEARGGTKAAKRPTPGLMDRLEDRWDKRRGQG